MQTQKTHPAKPASEEVIKAVYRRVAQKMDSSVSILALKDPRVQLIHKFDFDYLNCQNVNRLRQLSHILLREIESLANSRALAESPIFNLYEEFSEHVNHRFIDLKQKNLEISSLAKYYKTQLKGFKPIMGRIIEVASLKPTKVPSEFNCKLKRS
jgi:hypothetical protein